ncbi:MAG: NfeD family protein [Candidatus Muiribacteriota bacterium]
MEQWIYWVATGIILCILEIFTSGFFLFNFGVSSIITGLFVYFGAGLSLSLTVFVITNIILFIFIKKIAKKIFNGSESNVKTNFEALIGKNAIVTNKVSIKDFGEVKVGGEIWHAVPENEDEVFDEGKKVVVVKSEGNKLFVREVK